MEVTIEYKDDQVSDKPPISLSIMKLVFNQLNSPSGNEAGWICCIDGFKSNYAIYIDSSTGKTIVSGLRYKKTEHNSVQEAMDWCQADFESKVLGLFEDSRFRRWKENNDVNCKLSNETAKELFDAMDEEDK